MANLVRWIEAIPLAPGMAGRSYSEKHADAGSLRESNKL